MKKETCKTCYYYFKNSCRFKPPELLSFTSQKFPSMSSDDWCGKWLDYESKPDNATVEPTITNGSNLSEEDLANYIYQ